MNAPTRFRVCIHILLVWALLALCVSAQVFNVKVVTDGSPDYSDISSMVRSITAKWPTDREKCWAIYYWNHIARRQTAPMILHGRELTDPIRQFNDYGYAMCSTVAGVNCSIWDAMGLPVRFWDISMHTVSECFYDGAWHMYDNSMSAIYTRCDGQTIAGVEEIGRDGACAASGSLTEPGHIAKYHCLFASSANGFLTGADCPRDLVQEYRCFKPSGLKHRYYYHNWDRGHRYILNLRDNEVYTRYYHSLGDGPQDYVPNRGKDPEAVNKRYRIRGNGTWQFAPSLTPADYRLAVYSAHNIQAVSPAGLIPATAGKPAEVVFKVNSANVTTSQRIRARFSRKTDLDVAFLSVSTTAGLTWRKVWTATGTGDVAADVALVEAVNGAYEILIKAALLASSAPSGAQLKGIDIETTTMLNSKTQPRLRLGRNSIHVGLGDQTDAIVLWPDLQGDIYKPYVVDEKNMATQEKHPGYLGVMHAVRPNEEAYVVFRVDAPNDIVRLDYGGRFYNRAPKACIRISHSFDEGATWHEAWALTRTEPPWDFIHYEKVEHVPTSTRSVLLKYSLNASAAGKAACSIYSVRAEVNHRPVAARTQPVDVTFTWDEIQPDRSRIRRGHTQRVEATPFKYVINTGGADHPVVESLRVNLAGAIPDLVAGYSDGKDVGGERFRDRWVDVGRNLLEGKPYTLSVPPTGQWGGSDTAGKKLTDGVVGSSFAGGTALQWACSWNEGSGEPLITVDMGSEQSVGAFRIHVTAGWPWWDALKGEVKDRVEVFTSLDRKAYRSHGFFDMDLWYKDVPVNHMLNDEETARGWNFEKILDEPVRARHVRFKVTPKRALGITEVQALDTITYRPFDVRIALPDHSAKSLSATSHNP